MNPKMIGLVVLDYVTTVDVIGPAQAFAQAKIRIGNQSTGCGSFRRCYRVLILGAGSGPCLTECGIELKPHLNLEEAPPLDTMFVCGGGQIHHSRQAKKLIKWLKQRVPLTRRIVALGSGIDPLAATELLNGRQVAVHWRLAKDVARRFPNLQVNSDALFARDDRFYTCAGGAAAFDLSLSLIEEDYGRQIALKLAREMVLPCKRSGEQEQYSDALRFQVQSSDRFADLPAWILSHLGDDLSIEALAERAAMSRRNFTRLFHQAFGKSPAQFVGEARIAEARQRLLVPRNTIESIANSLGFRSPDVFSVAFARYTGIRPRLYRALRRAPKANGSANAEPHKSRAQARSTALRAA